MEDGSDIIGRSTDVFPVANTGENSINQEPHLLTLSEADRSNFGFVVKRWGIAGKSFGDIVQFVSFHTESGIYELG